MLFFALITSPFHQIKVQPVFSCWLSLSKRYCHANWTELYRINPNLL